MSQRPREKHLNVLGRIVAVPCARNLPRQGAARGRLHDAARLALRQKTHGARDARAGSDVLTCEKTTGHGVRFLVVRGPAHKSAAVAVETKGGEHTGTASAARAGEQGEPERTRAHTRTHSPRRCTL